MLHNIQLDDDQLRVLDKALRKGVFEEVAPVISAINLQLTAALKAQQEEEARGHAAAATSNHPT